MADINIILNDREFEFTLNKALNAELSKKIISLFPKLNRKIEHVVGQALRQSPEWESLTGGILRSHFGLADASFALDTIIETIQSEAKIKFDSSLNSHVITVELLSLATQTTLASIPGTSYISEPSGSTIPWLQWLLFAGNEKILLDYQINLSGRNRTASRTGSAIMVKPTKTPSVGWGVPIEFSGEENDNWLTRTLEPLVPIIFDFISLEVEKI